MRVGDKHYRSIWLGPDGKTVRAIDQRLMPHAFVVADLVTLDDFAAAISDMLVRGAPLIGATAAYGVAAHTRVDASDVGLAEAYDTLYITRPTAVNLRWALDEMRRVLTPLAAVDRTAAAYAHADQMADHDVEINRNIGLNGLPLLEVIAARKGPGATVNVLTHCNAGWLAAVDWGTATSPIYHAHDKGLNVHVWIDETRPRNQGAHLTAWEMASHGVPHTLICDNAGGHLMQHGQVDLVITGTDRTTARGDVCNKIGTYLKALAAHDNGVPFYVALPSPTIDWTATDGVKEIPIEERSGDEVSYVSGRFDDGGTGRVRISPEASPSANPAFDVTPARLVTGLITERGVCEASAAGLASLFPGQ